MKQKLNEAIKAVIRNHGTQVVGLYMARDEVDVAFWAAALEVHKEEYPEVTEKETGGTSDE